MKKFLMLFFLFLQSTIAANSSLNIYFFYSNACPHCDEELKFLQKLKKEYPLEIKSYEVTTSKNNNLLLQKITRSFHVKISGLPFLLIKDQCFIGFDDMLAKEIKDKITRCLKNNCRDLAQDIINDKQNQKQITFEKPTEKIIDIPLLGKVDASKVSLLILTIIMGLLDGFNPCAMWTLVFLITLLLGMKNKKRMWILGSAFIIASAFVYFMFMSAWLNFFLFLGFIVSVRIAIGSIALLAGGYKLKEFFLHKEQSCKITKSKNRLNILQKLKSIVSKKSFFLALGGVIILAFMVNLIELVCSAGLPAIYTQVLALNDLSFWQYYLYILLYIFFYMLDDLIIFFLAMITLEISGLSTKYVKHSQLLGGLIMLIIGTLLIFKPKWLMFGF